MRITRALIVPLFSAAMLVAPQSSQAGCCGLFDWLFHRQDACCPPQTYSAGYGSSCCASGPTMTYRPVFRRFALFRPWTTASACCAPQTVYRPIFGSAWSAPSACCPTNTCGTACGGGCNSCGTSSFAPTTYATIGGGCSSCTSGYAPATIISDESTISGGTTLQPTPLDGSPLNQAPRTFSDEGVTAPQSNPGTGEGYNNSGTNDPIRIQDPNNRVTSAPRSWTFRQTVARPYEVKPRLIPVQQKSQPQSDEEGWSESDR